MKSSINDLLCRLQQFESRQTSLLANLLEQLKTRDRPQQRRIHSEQNVRFACDGDRGWRKRADIPEARIQPLNSSFNAVTPNVAEPAAESRAPILQTYATRRLIRQRNSASLSEDMEQMLAQTEDERGIGCYPIMEGISPNSGSQKKLIPNPIQVQSQPITATSRMLSSSLSSLMGMGMGYGEGERLSISSRTSSISSSSDSLHREFGEDR